MRLPPSLTLLPLLTAVALLASACGPKPTNADARLRTLYSDEWKWRTDELAADEDSQKPLQDHLPKADAAAEEARLQHWQDVLAHLKEIPRNELSDEEQLNYDIYGLQIEVLIADQKFRDYEMPVNSDTTFWTNLSYTARRPFRKPEDYGHWISQMRDIPRYFREEMGVMGAGLKRGFTPPKITIGGLDKSITAVTEATPQASLFYTPFKDMPGIPADEQAKLR